MIGSLINWLLGTFGDEIRAVHELKSWPDEFDALAGGEKQHEVRRFDRDFMVGDWILLRRYDPESKAYSGEQLLREITHITMPGSFGLPDGLCVLSVK